MMSRGWVQDRAPAWVKCDDCEDWICRLHDMHVHDCPCPSVEYWDDQDPYSEGGPPIVHVSDPTIRAYGPAG